MKFKSIHLYHYISNINIKCALCVVAKQCWWDNTSLSDSSFCRQLVCFALVYSHNCWLNPIKTLHQSYVSRVDLPFYVDPYPSDWHDELYQTSFHSLWGKHILSPISLDINRYIVGWRFLLECLLFFWIRIVFLRFPFQYFFHFRWVLFSVWLWHENKMERQLQLRGMCHPCETW